MLKMSELGGQTGADPATLTASTSLAGPRPLLLRPTLSLFRRRATMSRKPVSASDPLSSPYTALRPLLTHDLAIATLAAPAPTPPTSASEERSSTETHSDVAVATPPLSEDVHAVPIDIFRDDSCDGLSAHPGRWPTLDDEPVQLVVRRSSTSGKSGVTAGSKHTKYGRERVLGPWADIKGGDIDVTALLHVEDDTVFFRLVEERVAAGRIPKHHVRVLCPIRQLVQTETSYNRHLRGALSVSPMPTAAYLQLTPPF